MRRINGGWRLDQARRETSNAKRARPCRHTAPSGVQSVTWTGAGAVYLPLGVALPGSGREASQVRSGLAALVAPDWPERRGATQPEFRVAGCEGVQVGEVARKWRLVVPVAGY